jgi:hypothetical protein
MNFGPRKYPKLEVLKIYGLAKLLEEGNVQAVKFIKFITLLSLPYAHTDPKRFEMYYKTILNVDSLIAHSSQSYGEVEEEDVPAFRLADTIIGMDIWFRNSYEVVRTMEAEWTEPIMENLPFSVSDKVCTTVFTQIRSELIAMPDLRSVQRFDPFILNQTCMGWFLPNFFFAEAYKGKNDDVEALGEAISSSIDIVHAYLLVCSIALPGVIGYLQERNRFARGLSSKFTNEQINAVLDRIQSLHPTDRPIDTGHYLLDTRLKMILKRFD